MSNDQKSFLILPQPTTANRSKLGSSRSSFIFPDKNRQGARLGSSFAALNNSFQPGQVSLSTSHENAEPEHVLVFETIGNIDDFYRAVQKIDGLDWLLENIGEEIEENEDFYEENDEDDEEESSQGTLPTRLYLVMSNRSGMSQLLSMWESYVQNGDQANFGHGKGRWKQLFKQLHSIRLWNENDRINATGLAEDWNYQLEQGSQEINLEIELWFRQQESERRSAQDRVLRMATSSGGSLITACEIPEIRYHSILIKLPAIAVQALVEHQNSISLAKVEDIMFFRPSGQTVFGMEHSTEELPSSDFAALTEGNESSPTIALLDGVPLSNHSWLQSKIIVDDPDNLSSNVQTQHRKHGTAMASLIINGDSTSPEKQLQNKIYVRPIMIHKMRGMYAEELIPEDKLPTDVIHQAIRRILTGPSAVAPRVKLINISICEKYRPFLNSMSPLSKLLDWLSWTHNILFVVSAGNHSGEINFNVPHSAVENLSPDIRESETFKSLAKETFTRRILSPSESLNALTVGASNSDNSDFNPTQTAIALLQNEKVCNLFSTMGLGYRNSVKPDVLAPGGRSLYRVKRTSPTDSQFQPILTASRAPGQKAASPGTSGSLNTYSHLVGTSNAAALVTRVGAKIFEQFINHNSISDSDSEIPESYWPVLAKSLIVHGASWGTAKQIIARTAPDGFGRNRVKNWITRFLGYGEIDESRSLFGESHRATTIAFGTINDEEAKIFEIPLPISLSAARTLKRVVITLAWLSPVEIKNRKYRKAQLWFTRGEENPLLVNTTQVQWQTARRGTVQHEILEGNAISTFAENQTLKIVVNCKSEAGRLTEEVKYGLSVTIESADKVVTTIYDEIKEKIRARVQTQT